MKVSELRRFIREEVKAVMEMTTAEKAAEVKAKQAGIQAKKIALKAAEDELKKVQATPATGK